MQTLHAIQVKYLGATDTLGSRVKLTSLRFGDSATIDYDHSKNSIVEMAINWIVERYAQNPVVGSCETPNGFIVLVNIFEPLKVMLENCGGK